MKNKEKSGLLSVYCRKNKITLYRLAKITGLSTDQILNIDNDSEYNVKFETAKKIYDKTKEVFGKGLAPRAYLSKEKYQWI